MDEISGRPPVVASLATWRVAAAFDAEARTADRPRGLGCSGAPLVRRPKGTDRGHQDQGRRDTGPVRHPAGAQFRAERIMEQTVDAPFPQALEGIVDFDFVAPEPAVARRRLSGKSVAFALAGAYATPCYRE